MKKLILIAILLGISPAITLADLLGGDCDVVVETYAFCGKIDLRTPENQTGINTENIIEQDAISTAFLNLKKVCCNNVEFKKVNAKSCEQDQWFFNDNVPDSTYLLDHLLDVIMRRLDGDEESIYKATNTPLDDKGKERRNTINEIAENVQGNTPERISRQYQKYRTQSWWEKNIVDDITKILSNESNWRSDVLNIMTNERNKKIWNSYPDRSLRERYKNACTLAGYLYFLFISDIPDKVTAISDTKRIFLKHGCSDLVEQRIENEAVYVNVIQTKRSNDLLAENINKYMNYYLSERLNSLQATIETIQAKLLRVVRAIEGIVKECV